MATDQCGGAAPEAGDGRQVALSVGQQAMWVAWQLDRDQWTHIIPLAFDIEGDLDIERLRTALATLTERYPHLRGRVRDTGDGAPVLDWSAMPPVAVRERITADSADRATRAAWQHPFDLTAGPLLRADVIRHPEGTVLLIAIHHLVCDGASVLTLLDALERAWRGEELGDPDDTATFAASADRSRALAEGPEGEAHRRFWRDTLGGEPPSFELPAPLEPTGYQVLGRPLDGALLDRVAGLAQRLGVSRFTVMFGVFFVLLRRYGGQDRLLTAVPFHGRSLPGTQGTVGYFVNVLPVPRTVTRTDDYASLITGLHHDMRALTAHGDLPLPALLRAAGLSGPDAHTRTHQVVFQWWDAGRHPRVDVRALRLSAPGGPSCTLRLRQLESTADYRAAFMLRGDKGGLSMLLKDPGGTLGPTLLTAMADDYVALLDDACATPHRPIGEVAAVLRRTEETPAKVVVTGELPPPWRGLLSAHDGTHGVLPEDVTAYVVDQDGNPAAPGVPGRLWLSGQAAALAASAGVPDDDPGRVPALLPLSAAGGSAWRTGLLARWLPGARLELLAPATEPGGPIRPAADAATPPACLDALADVWGQVLGIEPPGPEESFFELGGHSLLVGMLVTHVREDLGAEITLRDVFDHPRLVELAALVDERTAPTPAAPPTGPAPRAARFPASGFQERIWLAERLDPGRALYNVVLAWRIHGRLDPGTLEKALAVLVDRHEILRTRFLDDDGRLVQSVQDPWNPVLELLELDGMPEPDASAAVEAWLREAARTRFDPESGRLVRFALAGLPAGGQALLVCAHHLALDGESVQTLAAELATGYRVAGEGLPSEPPARQYRDFVAALEDPRARAEAAASVDFWAARLAGAPARLPLDPPSPSRPDGAFALELPDDLLPRLRAVGNERGISWFMVAATALAAALHRLTEHEDITFAVPVADSPGDGFAGLLGPRLGTAVLRSTRRCGDTLGDLLAATRETVLLLADHPRAPLDDLIARLAPPRGSTSTPFADVMLNMSSRSAAPVSVAGAEMAPLHSDERYGYDTKFGLTVTFVEDGTRLRAGLSYRGDRFDPADVTRLGRFLAALLTTFPDRLTTPLEALDPPAVAS
ncbi:condensation domain-containing protein [Streptomyces triculaminicus]|uniref:condensation domain-containing protein n=1 Tax=Streptomyces triculaminicus TaxID=2816232 RepID=UPI0033F2C0D5